MYVTVWIATDERQDVNVAPPNAFVYRENHPFVYVINRQTSTVELRSVKLGMQGFSGQEVISGIQEGDLLVTDGRFQLSNESIVKVLGDNLVEGENNK